MSKSCCGKSTGNSSENPLTDLVCGMRANEEITTQYKGQTHAFCSEHCKQQFENDPETYIAK